MSSIPAAIAAINTLLKLGNGASPEVFATIANVGNIQGPSLSANVVDVTSHSTDVPWRQKLVTLLDGGDVQIDLFFVPNSTGHQELLQIFTDRGTPDGLPNNYTITFPDGGDGLGPATVWAFTAFISKFNTTEQTADVIKASVTFTITGQPDFSA